MPASTVESRVQARLDADVKTAENAHAAAEKNLKAALKAKDAAEAKMTKAVAAMIDTTVGVTDAKRDVMLEAHKAFGKSLNAVVRAKRALDATKVVHATLTDPKEFARRMKTAETMGDGGEPLSGAAAAEIVLLQAGKALHYTEITRLALESGVLKLDGKTPEATMSAYLAKAAKKGDTFVRVEPGIFDLKARAKA